MDPKPPHGNSTPYTVRANPVLHESAELEGKLDYVRFTAYNSPASGPANHKEWRVDAAHLDQVLHLMENSTLRHEIVNNLRTGARVDLPGTYTAADLVNLGFRSTN